MEWGQYCTTIERGRVLQLQSMSAAICEHFRSLTRSVVSLGERAPSPWMRCQLFYSMLKDATFDRVSLLHLIPTSGAQWTQLYHKYAPTEAYFWEPPSWHSGFNEKPREMRTEFVIFLRGSFSTVVLNALGLFLEKSVLLYIVFM